MWYKDSNGYYWNLSVTYSVYINEDSPTSWSLKFSGPAAIPPIGPYSDHATAQAELDRIVEEIGSVLAT